MRKQTKVADVPPCPAIARRRIIIVTIKTGLRPDLSAVPQVRVEGKMSEKIYDVSSDWAKRALVDDAKYREMYASSVADPNAFWAEQGKRLGWIKPFHKVENVSFAPGNISIKWFEDGVLNVAWNCIDRHLATRADQTAIIWEGDDP